jgi:hypothetical protein
MTGLLQMLTSRYPVGTKEMSGKCHEFDKERLRMGLWEGPKARKGKILLMEKERKMTYEMPYRSRNTLK